MEGSLFFLLLKLLVGIFLKCLGGRKMTVEELLKNDTVGKSIKDKHQLDEKRADFEEIKENG